MALAGEELQKAKDLGKMLTDSKTVRDTSCALLYTSTSFASSMNLSTLYSCPLLCSPVSDFTPVCSQALTCHVNADNHQHACHARRWGERHFLLYDEPAPPPPSLQEYERLAAQLDGAKTDLTKKVNEISKAAAKANIVEAAEDHARNLTKMADDLEKYDIWPKTLEPFNVRVLCWFSARGVYVCFLHLFLYYLLLFFFRQCCEKC